MSNPLIPFVNPALSVATYQQIKEQLGQDNFIFQAMKHVAKERNFSFDLPAGSAEVEDKHNEIVLSLNRERIQARRGLFFDLVEILHLQLLGASKEVMAERLRALIDIRVPDNFSIKLNQAGAWIVQWNLNVDNESGKYETGVSLEVYKRTQHRIVPWHVVEYINSGIALFRRKAYAPALALMTVAVEATVRDALATRGYNFKTGASSVDTFKISDVDLAVTGNAYTLTFPKPMPKDSASLVVSGNLPIGVKIRRKINPNNGRKDLLIMVPDFLLDYLSSDQVEKTGQPNTISGLGQALSVACYRECIITATDLPPDLDDVLKAIRNNLLHLSTSHSMLCYRNIIH